MVQLGNCRGVFFLSMSDRNVLFCLVDPRWLRSCQASDAAAWYGSLAAARWTKMDQTVWFRHVQTSGRMNMKDLSTKIYEDHEEFKEEGYELMKEDHFLHGKSCGCPGCDWGFQNPSKTQRGLVSASQAVWPFRNSEKEHFEVQLHIWLECLDDRNPMLKCEKDVASQLEQLFLAVWVGTGSKRFPVLERFHWKETKGNRFTGVAQGIGECIDPMNIN